MTLNSESLSIETSYGARGARILKLSGPLTLHTLFDFQQTGRAETDKAIVVDLTDVSYMDSAGLGCLLGMLASCQRTHRGMALVGLSDRVRTLFKVTKVDGLLPTFDSTEAAEAAVAKPA